LKGKEKGGYLMTRRSGLFFLGLLVLGLFLSGCPKRPPEVVVPVPPSANPMERFLQAFAPSESLQAKASIRIDVLEKGERSRYSLSGDVFYQKPDKLRILGYTSFPMVISLFDAFYRNGEFFLLVPIQKRAYAGEVSGVQDMFDKAGAIEISSIRDEARDIPSRIRIVIPEKEIEIELRLKEVSVDRELPRSAFEWALPDGVEIRPLERLLRGKKRD
jgi:outer membrane lipoprotein-sorting protein